MDSDKFRHKFSFTILVSDNSNSRIINDYDRVLFRRDVRHFEGKHRIPDYHLIPGRTSTKRSGMVVVMGETGVSV